MLQNYWITFANINSYVQFGLFKLFQSGVDCIVSLSLTAWLSGCLLCKLKYKEWDVNGWLWGLWRTPAWYRYILVKQKNICSCDLSYFLMVPYAKNREQSMWPFVFLFARSARLHAPHSFKMHLKSQTSTVAIIRRSVWGAPVKMSCLLAKMLFKKKKKKKNSTETSKNAFETTNHAKRQKGWISFAFFQSKSRREHLWESSELKGPMYCLFITETCRSSLIMSLITVST